MRGGETRDTKPFSDLVFRDSALGYPRPTIKKFRTAYEMLQDERSGADAGTTAAAQPGLWQTGRNICGFGVEQQAAVVRPRAHEAFSPGLIGTT